MSAERFQSPARQKFKPAGASAFVPMHTLHTLPPRVSLRMAVAGCASQSTSCWVQAWAWTTDENNHRGPKQAAASWQAGAHYCKQHRRTMRSASASTSSSAAGSTSMASSSSTWEASTFLPERAGGMGRWQVELVGGQETKGRDGQTVLSHHGAESQTTTVQPTCCTLAALAAAGAAGGRLALVLGLGLGRRLAAVGDGGSSGRRLHLLLQLLREGGRQGWVEHMRRVLNVQKQHIMILPKPPATQPTRSPPAPASGRAAWPPRSAPPTRPPAAWSAPACLPAGG